MDSEADYSERWRELRRRRLIFWLWFLGYVPAVAAIVVMLFFVIYLIGLPRSWIDPAFYIIAGAWMVAILLASYRAMAFLCPRCHQPFFRTWWYYNSFARKCVHCGLPKWANSKDATVKKKPAIESP
jgi:Zn ribbon nucleic-acid-binding protein